MEPTRSKKRTHVRGIFKFINIPPVRFDERTLPGLAILRSVSYLGGRHRPLMPSTER